MDVRVVLEVLPPGVQDGQEPDLGPEVLGIGGDLLQGRGGGLEQQAVDFTRVLQGWPGCPAHRRAPRLPNAFAVPRRSGGCQPQVGELLRRDNAALRVAR